MYFIVYNIIEQMCVCLSGHLKKINASVESGKAKNKMYSPKTTPQSIPQKITQQFSQNNVFVCKNIVVNL